MDTSDNLLQSSARVAELVGLATEPPSHGQPKMLTSRVKTVLIGKLRDLADHLIFHYLSLAAILVSIGLGSAGLGVNSKFKARLYLLPIGTDPVEKLNRFCMPIVFHRITWHLQFRCNETAHSLQRQLPWDYVSRVSLPFRVR